MSIIVRVALMLASLLAVAVTGAFLLYVSPLYFVTAIAVIVGLVASLGLGYWAGSSPAAGLSGESKKLLPR